MTPLASSSGYVSDGTLPEPNAPRSGTRTQAIDDSPVLGARRTRPPWSSTRLTGRFGERTAFSDVSFHVAYGEVFGFLGLNGAGNTTTVRTLGTLIVAASGGATLAGISLSAQNGADIRNASRSCPEWALGRLEAPGLAAGAVILAPRSALRWPGWPAARL